MTDGNILIADFHRIVREGIKSLLESTKRFTLFEAETEQQVLDCCKQHAIDVLIMDFDMISIDSVTLARSVRSNAPGTNILTLMSAVEHQQIKTLHQQGVNGFLLKDADLSELLDAIDTLLEGKLFLCDEITLSVVKKPDSEKRSSGTSRNQENNLHGLTERELEVLNLIIHEYTNPEIAEKLSISVRTVDTHRRNLLQKTGSRNTAGLVRQAIINNLINE